MHGGDGRRRYDAAVDTPRYRCTACGNLTRFDVTVLRRTRSFHHYTLAGELDVEESDILSETVEEVSCRWCGSGAKVVEFDPASDVAPG